MNKFLILCFIATIFGGILGYIVPVIVPTEYNKLFSVAILAGIESMCSAIRLVIKNRFDSNKFLLNFVINVVIVVLFVFIGDNLGLDLYYVVLLALGFSLLQDLDMVKIYLFQKENK